MLRLSLAGQRRLVGSTVLCVAVLGTYWGFFSDGLPILWGPSARASEVAEGRELFEHEWEPNDPLAHGDGLGPVFNAKSCAACHFQGGLGGGGGNEHNATSFEVFPRPGDLTFVTGNVHNFSTDPTNKETDKKLRQMYPVVKGRTFQAGSPGCFTTTVVPDFDPVHTQSVQTTALFGAGWIDKISDRAILRNERNRGLRMAAKEMQFEADDDWGIRVATKDKPFDSIPVGRARRVAGGIGKFGWKAQFATLEEFVAAACANELGLGTPSVPKAKPLGVASVSAEPDLTKRQFRSLVSFVKTLPKPVETAADATAVRGKEVFLTIGCAVCHVPDIGGVNGVYSDFLLYTLENIPPPGSGGSEYNLGPSPLLGLPERPEDDPKPNEWKTPALWGVADSAPYMHDGSAATLREAIAKHLGDATRVTARYNKLGTNDQSALIAFLGTLRAPPDARELTNPAVTKLDRK